MVDKNGIVCEYDNYDIPPAPKFVTPEMRQRKQEIENAIKQLFEKLNAERSAEKNNA